MKVQKRIAAKIMKCSKNRVSFNPEKLEEIKEAITTHDIKQLIGKKLITSRQKQGISRVRANKTLAQKRKGRQKGHGSRKGRQTARLPEKGTWMIKIRKQRALIKSFYERKLIDQALYRELYRKCKGNFFRSERHIKLYLEEKEILKK